MGHHSLFPARSNQLLYEKLAKLQVSRIPTLQTWNDAMNPKHLTPGRKIPQKYLGQSCIFAVCCSANRSIWIKDSIRFAAGCPPRLLHRLALEVLCIRLTLSMGTRPHHPSRVHHDRGYAESRSCCQQRICPPFRLLMLNPRPSAIATLLFASRFLLREPQR